MKYEGIFYEYYVFFPIIAGIILIIKTLRKNDTTDMLALQNSELTRVVATFCIMYGHTLNAIKDTTIFDSINLGWCWVAVFFFGLDTALYIHITRKRII